MVENGEESSLINKIPLLHNFLYKSLVFSCIKNND